MAGGMPTGSEMPGSVEDDTDSLAAALADLAPQDTVITVSASGSTPYTLVAARLARDAGATVIGIANNAGSPLLEAAERFAPDMGVFLTDLDGTASYRPSFPVLWTVPSMHAEAQPPFGRKLVLE